MPLLMQSKILRVLQEREVERVGGVGKQQVDVRIIAATNRPLEDMVKQGMFREDLYYRLNIISLHIPPLRERKEDIPLLLSHHLHDICRKYGLGPRRFSQDAVELLLAYDWPGNVRELVNTVEMLLSLTEDVVITAKDLPPRFHSNAASLGTIAPLSPAAGGEPAKLLHQVKERVMENERDMIIQVLAEVKGNKAAAARKLGIHRSTLYEKLKKFGLVQ
jgi:DNA-binding NtrC family response regulator